MSDPNVDYGSVTALSEAEQRQALRRLVLQADQAPLMDGALGFLDLADMLGLSEVLGRPYKPSLAVRGRRDGVGRLRTTGAPATPTPAPFTPVPCQSGRHMKTEPGRCRDCKNASKRAQRTRNSPPKRSALPKGEVVEVEVADPNLCRCPGKRHPLYTAPNGRRFCQESTLARQRAGRAKAKAKRANYPAQVDHWADRDEAS